MIYSSSKIYKVRGKAGTVSDLARHFGIVTPGIAVQRVSKHGWDVEKAVTQGKSRHVKTYEAFGESGDLTSLVEKYATVSEATVRKRLQYGWTLEDALSKDKVAGYDLVNIVGCAGCQAMNHIAAKTCQTCGADLGK